MIGFSNALKAPSVTSSTAPGGQEIVFAVVMRECKLAPKIGLIPSPLCKATELFHNE